MPRTSAPPPDPAPSRDGVRFACVLGAWRDHEQELRGYLLHRLGDAHLADDLLQEVFVKAMRQGAAFCAVEQPRAWLFQVARNALVDHARAQRPMEPIGDDLPLPAAEEPAAVDRLAQCIERVIVLLDPADQQVLRRCDLEGMRQQDFAVQHGLSLSATKSRLLRARQRLRDRLVAACDVRLDESGSVCCFTPAGSASARLR